MSGYDVTVSITVLCPCCGTELPSNAYMTQARVGGSVFERDNPFERKDRRLFITPCGTCFVSRSEVERAQGGAA